MVVAMKRGWFLTWGPVVGYCLLIFFLSIQTTMIAPAGGDKVLHVFEYSVLGWLWARAARTTWFTWTRRGVLLSTIFFTGIYGASDEWHQLYVPGRFGTVSDVIADVCGGALGGISYLVWWWSNGK